MKRIAYRPSALLIKLLFGLTVVILSINLLLHETDIDHDLVLSICILLLCVFSIDLWKSKTLLAIQVTRDMPQQLSFNRWHNVQLDIKNNSNKPIHFFVEQHLSNTFEKDHDFNKLLLNAQQETQIHFRIKSLKRGPAIIGDIELCIDSPWRLWQSHWLIPQETPVKVYPDFKRINQQHSLKGINNVQQTGLKKLIKRGDGIEFHQLREYRQGDSIRQIDWQATSKRQKLIAKDYQEERNQHIIVMLDAGVNMKLETDFGTHFDAALNALLMLSHTVLKQGDWFSMQSFNRTERWLPAVKGAQNVSRVMNHFYDLEPDESASDYMQAVNDLLAKRSKRSLVLLVSTLNDQSFIDLLPAIKRLQQHHLVALVNIENVALAETLSADINNVSDANRYCAAVELKNIYNMNLKRLSKEGVICVESKPESLLPQVINTYLNVKHSGLL